jgi:hypothetical protein
MFEQSKKTARRRLLERMFTGFNQVAAAFFWFAA